VEKNEGGYSRGVCAAALDPSLPVTCEMDGILSVTTKLHELVAAKGHLKSKLLDKLVSSVVRATKR
jgi:hypothetical protein